MVSKRAGSLSSANTLPSLGFGIDQQVKPPASRRFQRAGSVEKGQMVWLEGCDTRPLPRFERLGLGWPGRMKRI